MSDCVSFYLNGKHVEITNPDPDLLLIDYLRSPEVGLTGAKKGCGQGGCGACTVILSHWDAEKEAPEHRAINSCLRPICALDGLSVTTVEGTGAAEKPVPGHLHHAPSFSRYSVTADRSSPELTEAANKASEANKEGKRNAVQARPCKNHSAQHAMNPVAYRLAINNGSQCGYCSTGFVMNMSAFLATNPEPTKRQIEDAFDGNICRCTGYRAILTGMKTFAVDWSEEDEAARMKCLLDDDTIKQPQHDGVAIPFPDGAKAHANSVNSRHGDKVWLTVKHLDELRGVMLQNPDARMVHGHTSFGIYKDEFQEADVFVDIRLLKELYGIEASDSELVVGAAVTYSQLLETLEPLMEARGMGETSRLGAAHFMARRTAGTIVRNAASIGGNTMLVLDHIHQGEPFPSDLVTSLAAIETRITYMELSSGTEKTELLDTIVDNVRHKRQNPKDLVLLRYHLPMGDQSREVSLAQKTALRDINAHSLVNNTCHFTFDDQGVVTSAILVFGGTSPLPWRPRETEQSIIGKPLTLDDVPAYNKILTAEIEAEQALWAERMAHEVWEGITNAYRIQLATSFLYKAVVNALTQRDPDQVPKEVQSTGAVTWGHWPVSDGRQSYASQAWKAPVSQPYIKLMAMYQTQGQVHYTHEQTVAETALNAAFVQSKRALADFYFKIPGTDQAVTDRALTDWLRDNHPDFVDLISADDIPVGGINNQGMGLDQPLFAKQRISYVGQSIALILARTEQQAVALAKVVSDTCIGYREITWPAPWNKPVLSIDRAIEINSIFPDCPASSSWVSHIWKITRPGSRFGWVADKDPLAKDLVVRRDTLDGNVCLVVEHAQTTGSQIHFYMETQACVAEPVDGECYRIRPSSQSPLEMHQTTAMALAVEHNRVEVDIPQVGGAYGGKTEPARFVTGPAAVAARTSRETVRLVMPRDEDTAMIGKRHPVYGQYQIAVDTGETNPEDRGVIRGSHTKMWADGGAFYDCSFVVTNCIQLRADNAYLVKNFENQIDVCRTNTAPNTAMRSFGDVQCKIIVENALDDAAAALDMRPELLRERNLYRRGDVTPFGQALSYCYMREVWEYLKEVSGYPQRLAEVEAYNRNNKWRKRGLAMVPVKYGSGYNLVMLEQAMAFITIFSGDGTIIIHQGGVDMGQGMITKVEQVASYILNVPMDKIRTETPRTSITANPTSTGASTGTAYNGEAVKQTCEKLRERMLEFGHKMRSEKGEDYCKAIQINFWDYPEGWAAEVTNAYGIKKLIWQNLVQTAYQNRVDLMASYTAPIKGGTTPIPCMTFKPRDEQPDLQGVPIAPDVQLIGGIVDSFIGFTYSAALSVVEVDILTGETKILRSDLVYDMGWSLNPAIDVGQVEGAFIQGVGYMLTEKLVFQPDGDEEGRLNTTNTWRYKPPAITNIPLELNTHLFPRDRAPYVPENENLLLSAKEVGEPPLCMAASVYFAVKDAVRASRSERGRSKLFRMDNPATVQEVRNACDVRNDELN